MKRGSLFVSIIFAFSFISCEKKYSCKCFKSVSNQAPYAGFDHDTIKTTRKKAEKRCADWAASYTAAHDSMVCYAYSHK